MCVHSMHLMVVVAFGELPSNISNKSAADVSIPPRFPLELTAAATAASASLPPVLLRMLSSSSDSDKDIIENTDSPWVDRDAAA